MLKLRYMLLALPLLLVSCSESDGEDDEFAQPSWKDSNTEYFNKMYSNASQSIATGDNSWKVIRTFTKDKVDGKADTPADFIVAHVINQGTGEGCPLYSDTVLIHYEGRLIPSKNYPSGKVFDRSWKGDFNPATAAPTKMGVYYTLIYNASTKAYQATSCIDGFSTALQNMHIGDHWQVYIPQELAYGKEKKTDIPAYSMLIFDITLVAYYHPGESVPDWKANANHFFETE